MAKKGKANSSNPDRGGSHGHTTLFNHILDSEMPESELSDERLAKEAQVLLGGGTASTARTITYISYYILAYPYIRAKLQQELREVMASYPRQVPSLTELERLPYLQALIKEGLRYLMHTDATVYEKPFEFKPERWLDAVHPNMNRNFVPFSRGSRNCLGMK
ncbi:MAG: hypothetical protein Q9185_000433 [Variospora sp. 1 TL-2023]